MRSKECGMIEGISKKFSKETTLAMWHKMCCIRYFELQVKRAFDAKMIKMPIYLSVGQESVAAALATVYKNPMIFGQHRCHDLYVAYGGDPTTLRDELLHRPTGCAKGMGGSASIHSPAIKMAGHDGFMGTQVALGVGEIFARGGTERGLVVMGDASAEEGWVLSSMDFAVKRKVPVFFICMDNNLSILTEVRVRRNYSMASVAQSIGMPAAEITDDPWLIMHYADIFQRRLPAFLNIHTVRHLWHSGTGTDGEPEWNRFLMAREEIENLNFGSEADEVERGIQRYTDQVWEKEFDPLFLKRR